MAVDRPKLLIGRRPRWLGHLRKGNVMRRGSEYRRDKRTHVLDVTFHGVVRYIDRNDSRTSSVPLLDLVHRILVAGGTVYHVCSRVFSVSK